MRYSAMLVQCLCTSCVSILHPAFAVLGLIAEELADALASCTEDDECSPRAIEGLEDGCWSGTLGYAVPICKRK